MTSSLGRRDGQARGDGGDRGADSPQRCAGHHPAYDVPAGFTRCSHALAWNGFFKWASERHTTRRVVRRYMRVYAAHASGTGTSTPASTHAAEDESPSASTAWP